MAPSRIRLIEITVAVSVVVISVASLFVAVFQGIVMQRTLEASVVPVVQYGTGNYDLERSEWRLILSLTNTGLGPAEIRDFRMSWNGGEITDTSAFLTLCCVPEGVPDDQRAAFVRQAFVDGEIGFLFDAVEGRFLAPQEEVEFVSGLRPDARTQPNGRAIWDALDEARPDITVEICYCSVFGDCWQARFPEQSRERVRQCPVRDR